MKRLGTAFAFLALLGLAAPAQAQKLSELPAATLPLSGPEITGLVQGGVTRRATLSDVLGSTGVAILTNKIVNCASNTCTVRLGSDVTGILSGALGGLGVANGGKTVTLGGSLVTAGAFDTTLTVTGATGITLPLTGTLATLAGSETLTNKTLVAPALGTPTALVGTNITGTAAGLTAGTATTNANLTGPITSVGNATAAAAQTGTGSTFVMQASPALTTPNLGTPSAGILTNASGLPLTTGVTGTLGLANGGANANLSATGGASQVLKQISAGAAVTVGQLGASDLSNGVTGSGAVVLATSPALVTPNLGTPSAATLTSAIGLPISTGVSGLGANVAAALATPTSANFAAAVTGETGTGALVFGTSPTLKTPIFVGSDDSVQFSIGDNAGAANYLTVGAVAAGVAPLVQCVGSDTNINCRFGGKGQGTHKVVSHPEAGDTAAGTPTTCGTTPSVSGTDSNGIITAGTGAVTACTLPFGQTWLAAPKCTLTGIGTGGSVLTFNAIPTTTAFVIAASADIGGQKVAYRCTQ